MQGPRACLAAAAAGVLLLCTGAGAQRTVSTAALQQCLAMERQANCDRSGSTYAAWPAADWRDCRLACCKDVNCAGWTHTPKSGTPTCYLKNAIDAANFTAATDGSSCAVVRGALVAASPSALPASCGGIAYVDYQRTRSGVPYVKVDAAGYLDCQMQCCADSKCRGWVFSPAALSGAGGEPPCAMIESPGQDYAAASVVSGAFLKPFPSASPSPYAQAQASFESAFFLVTIVLGGAFVTAVWYLRRDGQTAAAQQTVFSTVRAVLKRRSQAQEEQKQRLRRPDLVVEHAPGATKDGKADAAPPPPATIGFGGVRA